MDILAVAERAGSLSGAALTIIALIGAIRGWWVPRWLFDRESKRAEAWETLYNRERTYVDTLRGQPGATSK